MAFGLQSSPKLYDQVLPRWLTPPAGTFILKGGWLVVGVNSLVQRANGIANYEE